MLHKKKSKMRLKGRRCSWGVRVVTEFHHNKWYLPQIIFTLQPRMHLSSFRLSINLQLRNWSSFHNRFKQDKATIKQPCLLHVKLHYKVMLCYHLKMRGTKVKRLWYWILMKHWFTPVLNPLIILKLSKELTLMVKFNMSMYWRDLSVRSSSKEWATAMK
jgi:hypothetical protein